MFTTMSITSLNQGAMYPLHNFASDQVRADFEAAADAMEADISQDLVNRSFTAWIKSIGQMIAKAVQAKPAAQPTPRTA